MLLKWKSFTNMKNDVYIIIYLNMLLYCLHYILEQTKIVTTFANYNFIGPNIYE